MNMVYNIFLKRIFILDECFVHQFVIPQASTMNETACDRFTETIKEVFKSKILYLSIEHHQSKFNFLENFIHISSYLIIHNIHGTQKYILF